MEGLELQCFQIISAVGSARSLYIEAITEAKRSHFEKAEEMMKEGEAMFTQGHKAHASLIQKEASNQKVEVSLLLVHAEDQLMSAESFKIIACEMIETYKRLHALESNNL